MYDEKLQRPTQRKGSASTWMPVHSDHRYYTNSEQARQLAEMSLCQPLSGWWDARTLQTPPDVSDVCFAAIHGCEWEKVFIPVQGENSFWKEPYVCCVTDFTVSEHLRGKRLYVSLEGVAGAYEVWCNAQLVGRCEDGLVPSDFALSDCICPGENRLAVVIRNRVEEKQLGPFGRVALYARSEGHVDDLSISSALSEDFAFAAVSAHIKVSCPDRLLIDFDLYDRAGTRVARMSDLPAKPELALFCTVDDPCLWSAETPYLYTAVLTLKDENGVVESAVEQVGFRRFEVKKGVALLNGKRIVLRGVVRSKNCPTASAAVANELRALKRQNINAVFSPFYCNTPEWYRLCDQYGFYLVDSAGFEREQLPGRAEAMFERDKNHPSVLIWSCGGGEQAEWLRRRDPSRLVYDGEHVAPTPQCIAAYLEGKPQKPYIGLHENGPDGYDWMAVLEERYTQYQGGFVPALPSGALAQNLKAVFAPLCLTVEKDGVILRNKNLFLGTEEYLFRWSLLCDGECLQEGVFCCQIPPQASDWAEVDFPQPTLPGVYALTVSCCLAKSCWWAEAGFEVAFGQRVWEIPHSDASVAGRLQAVRQDGNLLFDGKGFSMLFSPDGLCSLQYEGREVIACPPGLMAGNASPVCTDVSLRESVDISCIACQYDGLGQLLYTVLPDGRIRVQATGTAASGWKTLLFGRYRNLRFYGSGPEESYAGCRSGSRLGRTALRVKDSQPVRRTGVYWLEVYDDDGIGLRLESCKRPFSFCARTEGQDVLLQLFASPQHGESGQSSSALSFTVFHK